MATAVTVISPRRVQFSDVAPSHLKIEGIDHYVWVVNGGNDRLYESVVSLAERSGNRVTVAWFPQCVLAIPWIWNRAIQLAQERSEAREVELLRVEDDVRTAADSYSALTQAELDLPALYHYDRPLEQRGMLGYRSVVDMCVLYRPHVLEALGCYDEEILGACDTEFGIRASLAGFSVGLLDTPRVVHLGAIPVIGSTRQEWWMYNLGQKQVEKRYRETQLKIHKTPLISQEIEWGPIRELGASTRPAIA